MAVKVAGSTGNGFSNLAQKIAQARREILVGVLDASVAEYATYVEYGWVQRATKKQETFFEKVHGLKVKAGSTLVNPPRPFLRGTMAAESKKWLNVAGKVFAATHDVEKACEAVGMVAVEDVRETIRTGGTREQKFAQRSPLTMAIYESLSKGHEASGRNVNSTSNIGTTKPLQLSGKLHTSIAYEIKR